jgi:hypothetical protein
VAGRVVAAYLKITTVLTQTQRENSVFNKFLLVHNVKDRSHVRAGGGCSGHPQNAVRLLRIEELCLDSCAPEREVEGVLAQVILLPEVNQVLHQKPLVHAPLSVLLRKRTLSAFHAVAGIVNVALVDVLGVGSI